MIKKISSAIHIFELISFTQIVTLTYYAIVFVDVNRPSYYCATYVLTD